MGRLPQRRSRFSVTKRNPSTSAKGVDLQVPKGKSSSQDLENSLTECSNKISVLENKLRYALAELDVVTKWIGNQFGITLIDRQSGPLRSILKDDYSEIERLSRVLNSGRPIVRNRKGPSSESLDCTTGQLDHDERREANVSGSPYNDNGENEVEEGVGSDLDNDPDYLPEQRSRRQSRLEAEAEEIMGLPHEEFVNKKAKKRGRPRKVKRLGSTFIDEGSTATSTSGFFADPLQFSFGSDPDESLPLDEDIDMKDVNLEITDTSTATPKSSTFPRAVRSTYFTRSAPTPKSKSKRRMIDIPMGGGRRKDGIWDLFTAIESSNGRVKYCTCNNCMQRVYARCYFLRAHMLRCPATNDPEKIAEEDRKRKSATERKPLGPRKKKIWSEFDTIIEDDSVVSNKCKICRKEVAARAYLMSNHLEKCKAIQREGDSRITTGRDTETEGSLEGSSGFKTGRKHHNIWNYFNTVRDRETFVSNICKNCGKNVCPRSERMKIHVLRCLRVAKSDQEGQGRKTGELDENTKDEAIKIASSSAPYAMLSTMFDIQEEVAEDGSKSIISSSCKGCKEPVGKSLQDMQAHSLVCERPYKSRTKKALYPRGKERKMCDLCGKILTGSLMDHRLTHTDTRNHVCPTCGKAFKRKHQLKSHHQSVHEGIRGPRNRTKKGTSTNDQDQDDHDPAPASESPDQAEEEGYDNVEDSDVMPYQKSEDEQEQEDQIATAHENMSTTTITSNYVSLEQPGPSASAVVTESEHLSAIPPEFEGHSIFHTWTLTD